jgi:hypothetical protein
MNDEDFGPLVFMYIPRAPERSYWEAEWRFPPTGTKVAIGLRGSPGGPYPQARAFYLALPAQFDLIVERARPILNEVFQEWVQRPLNTDLWADLKLAGFAVDDPSVNPPTWDVSFETTGEKWLGITIPFHGDAPQDPIVDT